MSVIQIHILCQLIFLFTEDADSAINAREIVSSIISAANRKLQNKQQQKSSDSLDVDSSYNERNIDYEICQRQASSSSIINRSQTTLSSLSSRSLSEEFLDRKMLSSSTLKSQGKASVDDVDSVDREFVSTTKLECRSRKPERIGRHHSDDSLLDRDDEIAVSHLLSPSWSLSPDTLDGLRRIEVEARAIREREELRRREKRRQELQRIEHEYQQTKKELEQEDSRSTEDLLGWRSDFSYCVYDGVRSDPARVPSKDTGRRPQHPPKHRPTSSDASKESGSCEAVLPRYGYMLSGSDEKEDRHLQKRCDEKQHSGGKYFVSVANSCGKSSQGALQGSLDSLAHKYSTRTGSLENILDDHAEVSRRSHHLYNQKHPGSETHRDSKHESRSRPGSLSQYGSKRHGSLDSLIDLIEKDNRSSWASSDSEDGSDLLTSLTSTFDQKLQVLLNPKYKLGHRRNNGSNLSDMSSGTGSSVSQEDRDTGKKIESSLPKPCVSSAPAQVILPQGPGEMLKERHFRDPSLHRKPEPKIGVACRFERGVQVTAPTQFQNTSSMPVSTTSTPTTNQPQRHAVEVKPFGVKQFTKSGQSSVMLTQPKKLEPKPQANKGDFRPISKSEKTEVNVTLARLSREEKSLNSNQSRPYSDSISGKTSSESTQSEKKHCKRSKRRHTVGGPDDFEHFKALIAVTGTRDCEPEPKRSAWEQLQPAIKSEKLPQNRTLLEWIRKERLRGSTPDLSSQSQD